MRPVATSKTMEHHNYKILTFTDMVDRIEAAEEFLASMEDELPPQRRVECAEVSRNLEEARDYLRRMGITE
jgi:hypothetical protein